MPKPRILIVENEGIIAKSTESYLRQAGYSLIEIALSGEDAIELSVKLRPDLILMDIVMEAELDGIETAAQIHRFLDVPVIYTTAHNDPEHVQRAQQTEPYGYLIKPIENHILRSTVEVALHKHAVQKKLRQQLLRLAATRAIDHAILSHHDLSSLLNIFLQQIVASLNVDAARILLFEQHEAGLKNAASLGLEDGTPEGYARIAIERAQQVFIPSLLRQTEYPHLAWLENEGFVSYLGVPLISNGHFNGTLEVFQRTELDPNDEWLATLDALAGQVDVGLDHISVLEKLRNTNDELVRSYDATIQGWSRALELRDQETQGHSTRVTDLTMKLAISMGYPEEKLVHLRRGALLHDIGKMGIPDGSLLKPGPLTDDDWKVMRKHPQYAYDLLKGVPFLQDALEIPHYHHEKWDGSGYPFGLKGEAIPMAARIFAVVDVWDALRSERLYRESWPAEKVLAYIQDQAGKHFDPQVVDAFLKLCDIKKN